MTAATLFRMSLLIMLTAYSLDLSALNDLPPQQHAEYFWFREGVLLFGKFVHSNTKAYFL